MRWNFDGFNALLHLRLAWVNNRFDNLFSARASLNHIQRRLKLRFFLR